MIKGNEIDRLEYYGTPLLYGPTSVKNLFKLYPELRDDSSFKELKPDELLFAWYMGIPNSPVDQNWDDNIRWRTAASKCFTDREKLRQFGSFDVSDAIKKAIRRFETMRPDARMAAKLSIQRIYHTYLLMSEVDMENDFVTYREIGPADKKEVVKEVDWTAKKQYVDLSVKIAETLPSLLKQIEDGAFGIREGGKNEEGLSGKKPIDLYHQQKQDS